MTFGTDLFASVDDDEVRRLEPAGFIDAARNRLVVLRSRARREHHVGPLEHFAHDRGDLVGRLSLAEHDFREAAAGRPVMVDAGERGAGAVGDVACMIVWVHFGSSLVGPSGWP